MHRLVSGERNTLFFFGPRSSQAGAATRAVTDDIEVFLINQGASNPKVGVRVGTEEFTTAATVTVENTWAYIAVNIYNKGNTAQIEVYINGAKQTMSGNGVTGSFTLRAVARDYNFMGYSPVAPGKFRGLIDTVQIWDQQISATTISSNALYYTSGDFPWTPQGLIVRFDFSEGTGRNARGRIGTAATATYVATLDYPRAVFSGGDITGWIYCMGWGDPHYQTYYWGDHSQLSSFDTQHVTGYFNILGCKNSAGDYDFHVSSWHVPESGGYYTINRAMSIRMGQSMFQFSSSVGQANGIPGTYVYKEIPDGADPAAVGWNAAAAGTTLTLGSGMIVNLPPSTGSGDVTISAAPYATIIIHNIGSYCNFDLWVNNGGCYSADIGDAVCKGHQQPVSPWVFLGTPNPTPPLGAATPIAPPPPGPACSAALTAIANTNCERCFPAYETTQSTQFAQCVVDVCFTGNPYCPIPACTPGEPCCQCASTGDCLINSVDNSTTCACDSGYGGADCSQSLNLVSLTVQTTAAQMFDSLPYALAPHNLDRTTAVDAATLISANPWIVSNSLLVYVATVNYPTAAGLVPSQHLYVVSDASSFSGSWSSTVGLTYSTGFDAYTGVPTAFNAATVVDGSSKPATATFTTKSTASTGFVIPNLPEEWCVTFTPSFADSVGQTVVGSGNIRGQLELLRVVNANSGFTVCGKKQVDPCPNLLDCKACTANAACGWCRTSSECHYGRPAGPTDGYTCQAWAFTFDEVTRRITQTYGYPVTPVDTTVVLSAGDSKSLPIEINVDMAYRYYTAWDVQVLFPNSASNTQDLSGLKTSIQDISDRLAANYLNSAISVGLYSSRAVAGTADGNGDNVVFNQVFPLVATTQSAAIYDTLVPVGVTARTGVPQLSVAVPRFVGLANNRANARTLVVIFATQYDTSLVAANLRATFTAASALPVFVVSSGVKAQYQSLVSNIGFGLVLDYSSSSAIGLAIDRALTDASGATFLTVDTENTGPIDTAALNNVISSLTVTGMTNQMRSRNNFPVSSQVGNSADAVILVPGFGKATIETVASDSPYTTGPAVKMVVGQALDPYTADVTIPAALAHLTGAPADVLQSTALVSASVKAVSIGQLYQFNETYLKQSGALVSGLVPVDFTQAVNGYVAVTDIQGRLVYHPPDNTFSNGAAVYATITYKVNDECSDSPDGTVDVYVAYSNNEPPTTAAAAVNTAENAPVAITLTATDYRSHGLNFVFPSAVTNNGGSAAIAGKIYQYSAACLAAATADVESIAACTEITAGSSLAGAVTVGQSNTRISTLQIIYVPYKYANSEGIPAVYLAKPVIQYRAVQIANTTNDGTDFVALQTAVQSFGVNISAVNQAPFAYKPTEASSWLSFDAASYIDLTSGCRATNDLSNTVSVCSFEQNMGVDYPGIPSPISLYAIGFDVDNSQVSVVVKTVTCPSDAILTNVVDGSTVKAGQTVNDAQTADTWAPAMSFRPSQDGSGDPYCTITYVITDGELDSAVQTIKVNISSSPLPPRSADQRFFAPRLDQALAIEFTAGAVNQNLASGLVKHYISKATITACSGDVTSSLIISPNTEALDCATVATTPYVIDVVSTADDSSASLYGNGMMHTFAGNWTPTALSVDGFAVTISYTDDQGLTSGEYALSFSYRQVNQAPEFQWVASGSAAAWTSTDTQTVGLKLVSGTASGSISYNARDVDASTGMVILTVDHNAGSGNNIVTFGSAGDEGWIVNTETGITATAPIAAINQIMSSLSVNIKNGGSKISFTVKIQVDDQGFSGACSQAQVTPCSKYGTSTITINASAGTPVVAIGLAAGAGGAAVAAAGAAAIAWRSLREPPTESYNPWEMDDSNEGTVLNPLFEGTGNSGSNAMFEGASKP